MPVDTTVESGPLVMDALAVVRDAARGSKQSAPLPEPTQAETPAAPATAETQEPVVPVQTEAPQAQPEAQPAGESKTEEVKPIEAKPEDSKVEPPKGTRDWRIEAYYKREQELAQAKKELDELKAKQPAAKTPEPTPATQAVNGKPVWDPEKYKERGYDGFIEDLATHAAETRAAAKLAELETQRTQQTQARQWQEIQGKFRQSVVDSGLTDYWDVVAKAQVGLSPERSSDFVTECVQSPLGPHILYHLAKNPAEVIRIDGLSKRQQYQEFEALENRFKTPAKPAEAPPAPPAVSAPVQHPGVSKAPPPVKTIPAGAAVPPRKSEMELALASPEEYQAAHTEIVVHRGIHSRKGNR